MWQMLRVYGDGGKLLKAVTSVYVDRRSCVRAENDVSQWFLVNVLLRQGCVMHPWLFIIIIILLKQVYKIQLANNKIQMAWLTCWLVVG